MQRILILGGTGFMGQALTQHLRAHGNHVSSPTQLALPLEDASALRGALTEFQPHVLINLAGISTVLHDDYHGMYDVNAFGHLRVLETVVQAAPRARVFLASSSNVYGQSSKPSLSENDLPAPISHYAISKLMAEQFNHLFADRLTVCAVRPFNCIGRGQKPTLVVSKIVDAFRRRLPRLELGDLSVQRDYVDIRDVNAMWAALIGLEAPPAIVNFGTGRATALKDVIGALEALTGHRMDIVSAPAFMRQRDITYQRADTTLLSSLGLAARYRLEDTLSWMVSGDAEDV